MYTFLNHWLRVTETLYSTRHTRESVCYYFRFIIALPMGRQTKRKCYRSPKRASWTLELSLPQINLFKVVLKSLKLLMESRASLPSPRILRLPCRWAFPIWNNSTREAYHVTLSRALEKPIGSSLALTCQQQHSAVAHKAVRFSHHIIMIPNRKRKRWPRQSNLEKSQKSHQ